MISKCADEDVQGSGGEDNPALGPAHQVLPARAAKYRPDFVVEVSVRVALLHLEVAEVLHHQCLAGEALLGTHLQDLALMDLQISMDLIGEVQWDLQVLWVDPQV
jgi:hypothetical protein